MNEIIGDLVVVRGIYTGATHVKDQNNGVDRWVRGSLYDEKLWNAPEVYLRHLRRNEVYFTATTNLTLEEGRHYTIFGFVEKYTGTKRPTYSIKGSCIIDDRVSIEDILNVVRNYAGEELADKIAQTQPKSGVELLIDVQLENLGLSEDESRLARDAFGETHNVGREIVRGQLLKYFGPGNKFPERMYDIYGFDAERALLDNPWEMLLNIKYITLEICDRIAKEVGIPLTSPKRINTIILDATKKYLDERGDTYLPHPDMAKVYDRVKQHISLDDFVARVKSGESPVIRTDIGYHIEKVLDSENALVEYIVNPKRPIPIQEVNDEWLDQEEEYVSRLDQCEFKLSPEQRQAVIDSTQHNLFILTGGPGVGKTTALKSILRANEYAYGYSPSDVVLMAPTGKAAQRMTESTGRTAVTIHKSLGVIPDVGFRSYENTIRRMNGKRLFVVDESSMLDTFVAGCLFRVAQDIDARIILIGDPDQLPSIGAGQILTDLLESNMPMSKLTIVQRQAEDSGIVAIASAMRDGHLPNLDWFNSRDDVEFIVVNNEEDMLTQVSLQVGENKTILSPYHNPSNSGFFTMDTTPAFNHVAQSIINPNPTNSVETGYIRNGKRDLGRQFRVGDQVISNFNRSDDIVNGSVGIVVNIWDEQTIVVDYDGTLAEYGPLEWDELSLAYAITVHKSQGSEYDTVVIPIIRNTASGFVNRNLLYTAITRAKKKLVLIGNPQNFANAVRNPLPPRKTALPHLLGSI